MDSQERHVLGQHRDHDDDPARQEDSEAVVQLREEELAARKEQVESGRVSLGKEIVEEKQTIAVPVTHEEVVVERHPVNRHPSDEPIKASSEVLRVPVREDQVSVDKEAVVYEEVNVGKRAVQETQRISDTVRKEVLDIDAKGNAEVPGISDPERRA